VGSLPPNNLEHDKNFLPPHVRHLVPVELLLEVLVQALSARELPQILVRRRPQPTLADTITINANFEAGDRFTAERARLRSGHELTCAVPANGGVATGSQLSAGVVIEADNTIILVILLLLDRALQRNGSAHFLLKNAQFFLEPLPAQFLVLGVVFVR